LKPLAVALYTALEDAQDLVHARTLVHACARTPIQPLNSPPQPLLAALQERVAKFESLSHAMSIFVALLASQYPSGRDGEVLPRKSRDMSICSRSLTPVHARASWLFLLPWTECWVCRRL